MIPQIDVPSDLARGCSSAHQLRHHRRRHHHNHSHHQHHRQHQQQLDRSTRRRLSEDPKSLEYLRQRRHHTHSHHHQQHRHCHQAQSNETSTRHCHRERTLAQCPLEKSVIIYKDENGFGLRVKGQAPTYIEHVHENSAAWRAGVRPLDALSKVNGIPVSQMSHKDVVLMFKNCPRFVALTLLSAPPPPTVEPNQWSELDEDEEEDEEDEDEDDDYDDEEEDGCCCEMMTTTTFHGNSSNEHECFSLPGERLIARTKRNSAYKDNEPEKEKFAATVSKQQDPYHSVVLNAGQCRRESDAQPTGPEVTLPNEEARPLQPLNDWPPNVCLYCRKVAADFDVQPTGVSFVCKQCQQSKAEPRRQQQQQKGAATDQANKKLNILSRHATMTKIEHNAAQFHRFGASLRDSNRQQQQQHSNNHNQQPDQLNSTQPTQTAQTNQSPDTTLPTATKSSAFRKLSLSVSSNFLASPRQAEDQQQQPPKARTPVILEKQQKINKRLEIIRELIDTERTHTERLKSLDELFYRPLKAAGLMTKEQLRLVFSCHRTLYKIHRQIYRILLSVSHNQLYASEPLIGSALLEIFEGDLRRRLEKAACLFCSAQASNVDTLNKLTRRDTKVGEFIAEVTSQRMIGRLGIKDLLASCFQRLTKYPLLLDNLLKATPLPAFADELDPDDSMLPAEAPPPPRHSNWPTDHAHGQLLLGGGGPNEDSSSSSSEQTRRRRNSRRMLAISLAEEREFIERALVQSRQILVRVNDSVRVSTARNKLKDIWRRTDKCPGVPPIDIDKQQVVHEGPLTLRLAKRSFEVYMLLLNHYIVLLTREGQDKFKLKFFTPDGKSSASISSNLSAANSAASSSAGGSNHNSSNHQNNVYSPLFLIDEHLTTRDAATDENGFYLLCKRKDDSRIYEFTSRSPAERAKWRESIQWTIERQMDALNRRASYASTITKSSSEISTTTTTNRTKMADDTNEVLAEPRDAQSRQREVKRNNSYGQMSNDLVRLRSEQTRGDEYGDEHENSASSASGWADGKQQQQQQQQQESAGGVKIVGTISYVVEDEIVQPSRLETHRVLAEQAIQMNVFASDEAENKLKQ